MLNRDECVDIEITEPVRRETDKAILVLFEDGEERWVPLSVVDDASEVYAEGDVGTLIVAEWWAKKNDLL